MCRYVNDTSANLVTQTLQRLIGPGTLLPQDPDAAIAEFRPVRQQVGLAGAQIAGHANGVPIGQMRFRLLTEAAVECGAASACTRCDRSA